MVINVVIDVVVVVVYLPLLPTLPSLRSLTLPSSLLPSSLSSLPGFRYCLKIVFV